MDLVRSLVAAIRSINLNTRSPDLRLLANTVMSSSSLVPPASVRGMTELDRSKFTTLIEVPALILGEADMARVMPCLKKYILKVQKFKPVQNDGGNNKIAFLDPEKVEKFEDIDQTTRGTLADNKVTLFVKRQIKLGYENWKYDQVFKAVFPIGVEVTNSYSKIGHLVHLNLRDSQLPLKKLIGEVLLDKVSHTRTVVNKLNTIDTTYRHFSMEIIAGDNDTLVNVTENGCRYKFDFANVYWNPRLSTEHQKLVSFVDKDDVLYDVFAGVGPFAIPAAVKGCKVMANDLNPESYRWLIDNSKINKLKGSFEAFNKDGREFLTLNVKEDIIKRRKRGDKGCEHIAMNLPALAYEFLDVFQGLFDPKEAEIVAEKSPTVHLYCFVKLGREEDPYLAAKNLVEDKIGRELRDDNLVDLHHVRNVSPNKEMMRVSFLLTRDILLREKGGGEGQPPAYKKLKTESISNITSFVDDNVVGKDGKEQSAPQDQKCIQGSRSS